MTTSIRFRDYNIIHFFVMVVKGIFDKIFMIHIRNAPLNFRRSISLDHKANSFFLELFLFGIDLAVIFKLTLD